jgi:hypothetical protein
MRLCPRLVLPALVGLVALAGCQMKPKLHDERSINLEPVVPDHVMIDAINVEQTVRVEFDAGGVPVNVYLVLGKDAKAAGNDDEKAIAAAKAKAENQASGFVSWKVPATEELWVYLRSDKQAATVKLKITN